MVHAARRLAPRSLLVTGLWLLCRAAGAELWAPGNQLLLPTDGDEASAEFGATLAVGDFNGDGRADLAVGSPFRDFEPTSTDGAGMVEVFFGQADRSFVSTLRVVGSAEGGWFGWALAGGDFDGDGDDELAIGAPRYSVVGAALSGAVIVFDFDGEDWLVHDTYRQGEGGLPGTSELDDEFGFTLAAGDFNDDGREDLAVGVPLENVTAAEDGAVVVIYGGAAGLTGTGSQGFAAGQGGVLGTPGAGDTFGWALAAADFDRDGDDDLAIGAPRRNVGASVDAGQVHVLRGGPSGITATADLLLDAVSGDPDAAGARFGAALAAGDFNYAGFGTCFTFDNCAIDLAVGSPLHTTAGHSASGRVTILYSTPDAGPSTSGADVLDQSLSGSEQPDNSDEFGSILAAGALDRTQTLFDTHSARDLVVGVPYELTAAGPAVGVAHLFLGGASGPGSFGVQDLRARPGLESAPAQTQDKFGAALAIGDFDGDGNGDLAVGLSRRDRPAADAAGAVQILFGALHSDGFDSGNDCAWEPAGCP